MHKPLKGKVSFIFLIGLVTAIILAVGFFLFVISAKAEWRDAPIYSEAQNIQSQVAKDGTSKTTTFTVNTWWKGVISYYSDDLRAQRWFNSFTRPAQGRFEYTDNSRDIVIPEFFTVYTNKCPAFYLDVSFEDLGKDKTRATLVQTVGPCGKPLS